MTKLKYKLSSLLTATMMLTSMSTNVFADAIPETANGTYPADTLNVYSTNSGTTFEGNQGVFSTEAEVVIKGDTATITLYMCNPILIKEAWQAMLGGDYGNEDGILQDFYVMDGSKTGEQYFGTSVVAYGNPDAPLKYFGNGLDLGPSYIEEGSYLPCDVLTIPNVPVEILENERFYLTGYFPYNNVNKEFFISLNYGEYTLDPAGDGDDADGETTTTHTTTITATVTATENAPEYSVIIPESISLGELDSSKDNTLEYSIEVSKMQSLNSVSVECEDTGDLKLVNSTNSSKTIDYTNEFNKATVAEAGSIKGTITVAQADVISADDGSYSGTINFKVVAE